MKLSWSKKFLFASFLIFFLLINQKNAYAQEKPAFVTGELIVQYKDGNTPAQVQQEVTRREGVRNTFLIGGIRIALEDRAIRSKGDRLPEEKLAGLKDVENKIGLKASEQLYEGARDTQNPHIANTFLLKTAQNISPVDAAKQFQSLPEVKYAGPNYIAYSSTTPNDLYYSSMWDLPKIHMPEAWDVTEGSNQVTVAVVDTGIDYNHEDFQGRTFVPGYDFASCADIGTFSCLTPKSRDSDPMDDNGHGTHVAGTIGAVTNNIQGVAGINWNVQLMAIKVMNSSGKGLLDDTLEGIRYAADNGAKVINMSLGFVVSCSNPLIADLQGAIDYARSKGVTVVVAAGNDSVDATNTSPASCNGVVSVGSTNETDTRSNFSNYGSVVDIAAPGSNIYSTNSSQSEFGSAKYVNLSGTSMASPHVAGAAALILARNPNLTPDQVEGTLKNNADAISTDRPIGTGRLNVFKAVSAVNTQDPTPTTISPSNTPIPPTDSPSATPLPSNTPQPSNTPLPLPADINRDGCIGIGDFNAWLTAYQTGTAPSGTFPNINNDSVVDLLDYNEWFRAIRGGQNLCP